MKRMFVLWVFTGFLSSWYAVCSTDYQLTLSMLYGSTTIDEAVIIEVIQHPAFQRLKEVSQYGVLQYMNAAPSYTYTRYEHSLGVFFILRRFGAQLDEQLAGLLHDVSHTAFSHVGDLVFNQSLTTKSHQDYVYVEYLKQTGLADLLSSHGFESVCAGGKELWPMLSRSSGQLCADRIEYNIKGALLEGMITEGDVHAMMRDLRYDHDQWYFVSREAAQLFGYISLVLTEHIWCADWNLFIYHNAAQMVVRAVNEGLLTLDDLQFSTDDAVWQKLCSTHDAQICASIDCIKDHAKGYTIGTALNYDLHLSNRFRGIDPLVMTDGSLQPLSRLDAQFRAEFERVFALAQVGQYLKLR